MHAFRRLLLTDLRNRRNTIMVTLGAVVLLNAALAFLIAWADFPRDTLSFMMSLNVFIFAGGLFVPFTHCFSAWRDEWKQHSIYLVLSLPVPRTLLLWSKYISILLEMLLISAVMIAGLSIQLWVSKGMLFRAEPLVLIDGAKLVLLGKWFLSFTGIVFLSSMSIFLGKQCGRLSLLVTFLSFAAGLLVWIVAFANFPSIATIIIFCLTYFSASLYLLEKKVGVE